MLERARFGWIVITNRIRRAPQFGGALFGVLGLMLAAIAQVQLQTGRPLDALLLFPVSIALFVFSFRPRQHAYDGADGGDPLGASGSRSDGFQPATGERSRTVRPVEYIADRYWLGCAIVALALSISALVQVDVERPGQKFWWVYLSSVVVFIGGAALAERRRVRIERLWPLQRSRTSSQFTSNWRPDGEPSGSPLVGSARSIARANVRRWLRSAQTWSTILPVLGIVTLAMILRLSRLDQLPFGTWYDEAASGLEALRMWRDPAFRPIHVHPAGVNATGHYLFLVLASIRLLGIETFSVRLISAVMGVLTVAAGYLLGREVSGHRFGLLLAFLLAVSRWAINFSRLGMYNISTPLFQLFALAMLLRAIRRGSVLDYALTGVSIGLGLSFYAAYQLFLPILAIAVVLRSCPSSQFTSNWRPDGEPSGSPLVGSARSIARADVRQNSVRSRTQSVAMPKTQVQENPDVVGFSPANVLDRIRTLWHGQRRSLILGLLVVCLGAALVIAPLAMFAVRNPDVYFSRVQRTALFSDKTPEQRLPALRDNIRKHLLMFNVRGDPNGRHNLPGQPMLDPISAGFLIIGVVYSALAWRRTLAGLWPLWLIAGLLGGILSLDFEAPQSLRSIGAFPAATIMVAIPIHILWRHGEKEDTTRELRWSIRTVVATTLVLIGVLNVRSYFVTQAQDFASWNAFSTPETIAARLLLEQPQETDSYVISLFSDHPTIRFLTEGKGVTYQTMDTTAQLPMLRRADESMTLILDADRENLFEEAKVVYPSAEFEEIRPPFGGPTVLYYAHISPDAASESQGLVAKYYSGTEWTGNPAATVVEKEMRASWPNDAPIELPFVVEWSGVLALDEFGAYQFFVQAPDDIELYVDENLIIGTEHSAAEPMSSGLILARGRHTIRVRAAGGTGQLFVGWRTPQTGPESIPPWHLYHGPVQTVGLLGTYYPNGQWSEPEAFQEVNHRFGMYFHLPRLNRPYTVRWTGKFLAPVAGMHMFGLQSIDEAVLFINGREVVSSPNKNQYAEESTELDKGLHDIEIRYADRTDHTYINVYWQPPNTPPGTPRKIIPPELLLPQQANYELINLPSLSDLVFDASTGAAVSVPPLADPATVHVVVSGLEEPRAVAVSGQQIYVAETGAGQVRVFDAEGRNIGTIRHPAEPFIEPFALDIIPVHEQLAPRGLPLDGPGNELVVLDAGTGRVSVFGPDGGFVEDLAIPQELTSRSRGMHVDWQGKIWLANTPGGRVVAFDMAGNAVNEIGHTLGGGDWQNGQPVDVVHIIPVHEQLAPRGLPLDVRGETFVVDGAHDRLVRYDAQGRRLLSWNIAAANTMDSAHIAADSSGQLYLTDPEGGLVLQLSSEGERRAVWSVRGAETSDAKPVGIDVDSNGVIWIADPAGGRLLRLLPADIGTNR